MQLSKRFLLSNHQLDFQKMQKRFSVGITWSYGMDECENRDKLNLIVSVEISYILDSDTRTKWNVFSTYFYSEAPGFSKKTLMEEPRPLVAEKCKCE